MKRKIESDLPIAACKEAILTALKSSQTLILTGETGSGKTTQLPQYLYEAGYGRIGITQPRRVAAISIATRVASELGLQLGQEVGYTIRFEDVTSDKTMIRYMTDGMLLRELLTDGLLKKYSVIVLDEVHERSLRIDILFGALKDILTRRKDLKVIVMSATLNAQNFSKFLNGAPILHVPGRQYNVKLLYAPSLLDDYLDAALTTIFQIHTKQPKGDILVFVTGQEEIENLEKLITEQAITLPPEAEKIVVCPIFASLPTSQQKKVFEPAPHGTRKVILSTNIAETSITINGIKYVVDTGMVKVRERNPKSGIEMLTIKPISKASADQRKGRAGRESEGTCYRLYTESAFKSLQDETQPEIKRCHLSNVLLLLKAAGFEDLGAFHFLDKPSRPALVSSLEELYALGALDDKGKLCDLGRQMASFPLDPIYAKVLLQSKELGCTSAAIGIISMLSVDPVFFFPQDKREEAASAKKRFAHFEGDHLTLLNVLNAYEKEKGDQHWCNLYFVNHRSMKQIIEIRNQLVSFCQQLRWPIQEAKDDSVVLKCLLSGLFRNIAILQHDGSYQTLDRQQVYIHPSSILFQKKVPAVMFSEWVQTTRPYLRHISAIQPFWIKEIRYYSK